MKARLLIGLIAVGVIVITMNVFFISQIEVPSFTPFLIVSNQLITTKSSSTDLHKASSTASPKVLESKPSSTTSSPVQYICRAPCTGMAPSEKTAGDCSQLLLQSQCSAFKSSEFPYHCDWLSVNYQCPLYP
jgi:hypothetical protein